MYIHILYIYTHTHIIIHNMHMCNNNTYTYTRRWIDRYQDSSYYILTTHAYLYMYLYVHKCIHTLCTYALAKVQTFVPV